MPDAPTLALLITASVLLDGHSTVLALRAGHVEANPFLRRAMHRAPWRATAVLWLVLSGVLGATQAALRTGMIAPGGEVHLGVFYFLTVASVAKLLAAANNYLLVMTGFSLPGMLRRRLGRPRSRLLDLLVLVVIFLPPSLLITEWLFAQFRGLLLPH